MSLEFNSAYIYSPWKLSDNDDFILNIDARVYIVKKYIKTILAILYTVDTFYTQYTSTRSYEHNSNETFKIIIKIP
jgi:hypothetical protein